MCLRALNYLLKIIKSTEPCLPLPRLIPVSIKDKHFDCLTKVGVSITVFDLISFNYCSTANGFFTLLLD